MEVQRATPFISKWHEMYALSPLRELLCLELNKQCFTRYLPLILTRIKDKRTTPTRQTVHRVHDAGLFPPPTPTIRYLRDLSPEIKNGLFLLQIRMASGSSVACSKKGLRHFTSRSQFYINSNLLSCDEEIKEQLTR